MSRRESLLELGDVASGQWGLFTTAQARRVGLSPQQVARLASAGTATRLRHGVYRLAGVPEDLLTEIRAAWLGLDPARFADQRLQGCPAAVVSHRSAARLHQLGDLDADIHTFTVPTRRNSGRDTRLHVGALTRGDWTVCEGLPVTTLTRTIGDLAATRVDGGHLAGVLRDAIHDHHLARRDAAAALRPYAHHYGAPLADGEAFLADLLDQAGEPRAGTGLTADQAAALRRFLATLHPQRPGVQNTLAQPETRALLDAAAHQAAHHPGARGDTP